MAHIGDVCSVTLLRMWEVREEGVRTVQSGAVLWPPAVCVVPGSWALPLNLPTFGLTSLSCRGAGGHRFFACGQRYSQRLSAPMRAGQVSHLPVFIPAVLTPSRASCTHTEGLIEDTLFPATGPLHLRFNPPMACLHLVIQVAATREISTALSPPHDLILFQTHFCWNLASLYCARSGSYLDHVSQLLFLLARSPFSHLCPDWHPRKLK